jgi:hypothetical protein
MGFSERRHPKNTVRTQNMGDYCANIGGILRKPLDLGVQSTQTPSRKSHLRRAREESREV